MDDSHAVGKDTQGVIIACLQDTAPDRQQEVTRAKREQLTGSTRLGHDLGVDGDDAAELMQAFAQRFQVDMSDFEFDLHFGPEAAFNPFTYLYCRLFKPHELKPVPITIEYLAKVTEEKKWDTPQQEPY